MADDALDALASPPSGLAPERSDWMKALASNQAEGETLIKREQAEMAPQISKLQAMEAQPRPPVPSVAGGQLQKVPQMRDLSAEQTAAANDWIKTAFMLAGISSAFTRRGVTTALGAFGAAVKGFREGQQQQFQQSAQQWKAAADKATQDNRTVMDEYNAVLADRKLSLDEQMQQIELIATKYKDPLMLQAAQAKNITLIGKLADQRDDADRKFKLAQDKLVIETLKAQLGTPQKIALAKFQEEHKDDNGGSGPTAAETVQFLNSMRTPRSGTGMFLQSFMEDFRTKNGREPNPGELTKAMADYQTQIASEKGFGPAGPVGKNLAAINTAVNHLDTWERLAAKAATGDVQAFNAFWNALRTQILGDPTGVDAQVAAEFVGPEIVKAIVANGGGVTEREQVKALLSTRLSAPNVHGTANTARELLAGRLGPIRQQYEQSVGGTDFDEKYLSPRAREIFTKMQPGGGGGGGPPAGAPTATDANGNQVYWDGSTWKTAK